MSEETPRRTRPAYWPAELHELYDTWLVPNGIDGWLPEDVTFEIDTVRQTITYPAFRTVDGGHGTWEAAQIARDGDSGDAVIDQITVPMVVAPTGRVRELVMALRGDATRGEV